MVARALLVVLVVALARAAPAATLPSGDAYWVFFHDKSISSDQQYQQALAGVVADYNPAAAERRERRGISPQVFGYSDLPVADAYLSAVLNSGASLRVSSSWLNAVSLQADASQMAAIAALPFVDHVQGVSRFSVPAAANVTSETSAPAGAQTFYGSAQTQLDQIHITDVHNLLGFTGAGVTIGILDTGFKRTHEAFNYAGHPVQIVAEHDFINNDGNTADTLNNQHVHGTYILGTIGGYKPNTLVGGAYNASFLLAKTEVVPTETRVEEDYWVAGLQWLEANGADVVTSSLGYIDWYTQAQLNGQIAVTTVAADYATRHGLAIVNAAGNEGHDNNPATSSLISPADAELLITVGAVDSNGLLASFSSSGPTADGRIKPEVLAMGVGTWTVNPSNDTLYLPVNGTSLSTPLVASTVALMLEANPNLTVPQIRQALFSTASRGSNPDTALYNQGYGIINAYQAVLAAEAFAVPEPPALALLVTAMVALLPAVGLARRKRRSAAGD